MLFTFCGINIASINIYGILVQREAIVKKKPHILITDRNSHICAFLKREMEAEGYCVSLAQNSREISLMIWQHDLIDIMILDPDLPDIDESALIHELKNRIPVLNVVIHTSLSDCDCASSVWRDAVIVEKSGASVEELKRIVEEIMSANSFYSGF